MFNVLHERSKNKEGIELNFFTGIPTPAGAILILLPLTHIFIGFDWVYSNLNFIAGYIILISGLLISKIPTFSIKGKEPMIRSKLIFLFIFLTTALSMINFPWQTLNVLAVFYLLTIPVSILQWRKTKAASAKAIS